MSHPDSTATLPEHDGGTNNGGTASSPLIQGLTFLLVLTVIQRFVGLARQVLFCGFLSDDELGRWSLTFNFLSCAAPLAVLGIPGSFGRYVEHYRGREQLKPFLRHAVFGIVLPSSLFILAILAAPQWFSWLLYNDTQLSPTIPAVALALALLIVFNSLTELLMAMRLIRAATVSHFVNSLSFTALAFMFLAGTSLREHGLILVFIASTVIAGGIGMIPFVRAWKELPQHPITLAQSAMWRRVLPFAGWVWLGNLAANLFDMVDQFLIKHWTGVSPFIADAMLGQYYTSRIIPNVMNSLVVLIGSSLLPYLVADWERGEKQLVAQRVNTWMKLIAISYTAAGAVGIWIAPTMFRLAFGDKFDVAVSLLPFTMAHCVWFSMAFIGQRCLACAERSSLTTASLCISLGVNVLTNLLLLPIMGLMGAVLAAVVGHLTALAVTLFFNRQYGMRTDLGVIVAATLPFALCLGPPVALAASLMYLIAGASQEGDFLSSIEKAQLRAKLKTFGLP